MRVHFWGVRGSISAPGPDTIRYGGNTPCVAVETAAGGRVVVDGGYGLVGLGSEIMKQAAGGAVRVTLVLTHLHWDHIQGIPFFIPIYVPGNHVVIYSASVDTARAAMERLFTSAYSPIKGVENLGAQIQYETLISSQHIEGVELVPIALDHGVPTLGLRMSGDGAVVCHATDHEAGKSDSDGPLVEAATGADLLIHDAQFTEEQYRLHRGWGHSHELAACRIATAAKVRRLALFHYDPTHTDADVDRQLARAEEACAGTGIEVLAAAEGATVEL